MIIVIISLIARKLTFEYGQMRVTSKIPDNYEQNAIRKTIYIMKWYLIVSTKQIFARA